MSNAIEVVADDEACFTTASAIASARAVADAAAALPAWAVSRPNARRAELTTAADLMEAKTPAFVSAMTRETGATEGWLRFNAGLAVGMIREAAALTTQVGGQVIPSDKPGCIALAVREPAGVVLGIAPWNAPVILGVRAIATALSGGNPAILKSSEICPDTHGLIVAAFVQAGLSDGIINVVTNTPEDAGAVVGVLIDDAAVRRINFTGTTAVGRIIAVRAAQNLNPCLPELGGKAPLIVLEDADLDEAVEAAAFGAFMNAGQICMSTDRIIVIDAIADAFAEKFATKVATMSPCTVIDRRIVAHVESLVGDALAGGGALLAGGDSYGLTLAPRVVLEVTPAMRLFREESFWADRRHRSRVDRAARRRPCKRYGIRPVRHHLHVRHVLGLRNAGSIKSGICHINGPTVHDEAQMPFGSTKASRFGRFGGKAGIDAFR